MNMSAVTTQIIITCIGWEVQATRFVLSETQFVETLR